MKYITIKVEPSTDVEVEELLSIANTIRPAVFQMGNLLAYSLQNQQIIKSDVLINGQEIIYRIFFDDMQQRQQALDNNFSAAQQQSITPTAQITLR